MTKTAQFDWDVFVSHNRHQKSWVRALVEQWRSLDLKVFFDEDTIEPGEDVVGAIERGIETSRHVLFIITPMSVASPWVAMETATTIMDDPDVSARRLIPVLLEPTPRDSIRPAVRRLNLIDLTDSATRLDCYHRLLKFLQVAARPPFPGIPGMNGECSPGATHAVALPNEPATSSLDGDRSSATLTPTTKSGTQIEIIIDRDFESYSQHDLDRLFAAAKELFSISGDIRLISQKRGSVRIRIELTPEQAGQLYQAVKSKSGALVEHGVVDVKYPDIIAFPHPAKGGEESAAAAEFHGATEAKSKFETAGSDKVTETVTVYRGLAAIMGLGMAAKSRSDTVSQHTPTIPPAAVASMAMAVEDALQLEVTIARGNAWHFAVGDWPFRVKRAIDVLGALSGLVIFSPLMFLIALFIRLDGRGPIFFRQLRRGYHGRLFSIRKFRTMSVDAEARLNELEQSNESAGGVLFKLRIDPRVTRIGWFLRRRSLDELPQLFNVLKGEMSLVGPLPLQLRDSERLLALDPEAYVRRLQVMPGITGPWQVGGRSELNYERMVELDLDYVENWSVAGDIKIICKTFVVVLLRTGAY
jgi:lipopolysaccharide/colanic/teichoic acid biosynthesis glycosyltransferase